MIGVLVSGEGTNLQALLDDGLPVVAVASNSRGRPCARARRCRRHPGRTRSRSRTFESREDRDRRHGRLARGARRSSSSSVPATCSCSRRRSSTASRAASSTSTRRCCPRSRARADRGRARRGGGRDRRYRPLRGRGRRHRPDHRAGASGDRAGRDARRRCASALHAVEHRLLPQRAPRARRMIERALLSVYDKTGLDAFARGLAELGVELVASGGTAAFIEEHELGVTLVEELTGVGELLGGRVKTLHPRIHAAILARPDAPRTRAALDELGIRPFQLVCVNLYPFGQIAWRRGVDEAEAVEMIDVGGPAMLRAAAKNFAHVAPVCRPDQYERRARRAPASTASSRSRRAGGSPPRRSRPRPRTRRRSPAGSPMREAFPPQPDRVVREGARPRVRREPAPARRLYAEDGARRHVLSRVEQLQGKQLSFNNLADLSAARAVVGGVRRAGLRDRQAREPCGVALGGDDRGGVRPRPRRRSRLRLRRRRRLQPAGRRASSATRARRAVRRGPVRARLRRAALGRAGARSRRRACSSTPSGGTRRPASATTAACSAACSSRTATATSTTATAMEVVCGEPTEDDWGDLLFAWRVCKHVTSNAIVLARELQTIGIGAGQMSRVDAVRIARREGARARPRLARRGARVRRVLPVRRRAAARARGRRARRSSSPAGRSATTR